MTKKTFTQDGSRQRIDEMAAAFGLSGSRPNPATTPIDPQPPAPYLLERMRRLNDEEMALVRQKLQWRGANTSTVATGAISTQAIGFIQRCEDLPGGLDVMVAVLEEVRPGLISDSTGADSSADSSAASLQQGQPSADSTWVLLLVVVLPAVGILLWAVALATVALW